MIIAIFAMLLIVNRQTGLFFEEFFVYLLPLPMAVYTALYDWKYGLMVFVGMTAFSFIFGGFTTIFYAVSASLIGLVFGTMVCRKVDPTKMLIIIMVFSAISTIISSVALASLFGYDIDMSLTEMKTMLTTTFEATGNGALMEFYKTYSNKTISNVFWSANNYELPHPALKINSRIEYWYGEYEKKARKNDMAYINSYFEGVTFRQIDGMEHGELVMIHLSRFDRIIKKALEQEL